MTQRQQKGRKTVLWFENGLAMFGTICLTIAVFSAYSVIYMLVSFGWIANPSYTRLEQKSILFL
jgi:hypothetical protein